MDIVGTIIKLLAAELILIIIPLLAGNGLLSLLGMKKNIANLYLSGLLLVWAIIQLVAVPFVLMRLSFTAVFWTITGLVGLCCIYGICRKDFPALKRPAWNGKEWVSVVITILCVAGLLFITLITQHSDADDSRFVVNAVDMLRTDTMFLTNPATGEALDVWKGELIKDVTAPWAVFFAWCAKLTGTHATVMAHTVLPQILLLAVLSVWWLLSDIFFKKELVYRCLFIDMAVLVTVYGGFSVYSEEVFMLTRIWQGKAVVAALGIPSAYLFGSWIYGTEQKRYYVLPVLLNLSLCLMSGMGLIIGVVMLGCIGLVYGISKKNRKMCLMVWLSCIPNLVYYAIHLSI